VIDDALGDEVRVTVIAAGFDEPAVGRPRPRTASYGTALPSAELAATGSVTPSGSLASSGSTGSSSPSDWRPFQIEPKPAVTAAGAAGASGAAAALAAAGPASAESPVSPAADSGGSGSGAAGAPAGRDGARIEGVPPPRAGSTEAAKDGQAAKPGSGRPAESAGTRRKSVVFEEDDELDVPDFLK
jgi:cell division protein FtsZ